MVSCNLTQRIIFYNLVNKYQVFPIVKTIKQMLNKLTVFSFYYECLYFGYVSYSMSILVYFN